MNNLHDTIKSFSSLKENWDSYNAGVISQKAIDVAISILHFLPQNTMVYPMRNGGIQFEFDFDNFYSELEINSNGEMLYILYDTESYKMFDMVLNYEDLSKLFS